MRQRSLGEEVCLILLAVQNARLREAQADCLMAAGFKVAEVVSADKALSYLESRSDICLTIVDIDMPGCFSGLGLARFIHRRWPPIYIIILGWSAVPTLSLPQPRSTTTLLQEVRKKLSFWR
jgi:DNA-binding NtrC family response regulator